MDGSENSSERPSHRTQAESRSFPTRPQGRAGRLELPAEAEHAPKVYSGNSTLPARRRRIFYSCSFEEPGPSGREESSKSSRESLSVADLCIVGSTCEYVSRV